MSNIVVDNNTKKMIEMEVKLHINHIICSKQKYKNKKTA